MNDPTWTQIKRALDNLEGYASHPLSDNPDDIEKWEDANTLLNYIHGLQEMEDLCFGFND
jgi:hypothetical protein